MFFVLPVASACGSNVFLMFLAQTITQSLPPPFSCRATKKQNTGSTIKTRRNTTNRQKHRGTHSTQNIAKSKLNAQGLKSRGTRSLRATTWKEDRGGAETQAVGQEAVRAEPLWGPSWRPTARMELLLVPGSRWDQQLTGDCCSSESMCCCSKGVGDCSSLDMGSLQLRLKWLL